MWDDEINEEEPEEHTAPWQLCSIVVYILMWQFCYGVSDTGVLALLLFLHGYFKLVLPGNIFDKFPKSLKSAFKLAGIDTDLFTQYIVCPSCNSVFDMNYGYIMEGDNKVSNKCPYIAMPNYQFVSQRQPCKALLMKTVQGRSGNMFLRPHKIFAYHSVKDALKTLISQKGFSNNCEQWRSRQTTIPNGVLGDIYEGRIWREFLTCNGEPFLESQYTLCFTLNVDWFQPYTHTSEYLLCINS